MKSKDILEERTIMRTPISEVSRQCSASREIADKSDIGPIDKNVNPLDICIEGGNEIINNPELLTFFRNLYIGEENIKFQTPVLKKKYKN